jgi:hypothetical protein
MEKIILLIVFVLVQAWLWLRFGPRYNFLVNFCCVWFRWLSDFSIELTLTGMHDRKEFGMLCQIDRNYNYNA